MALLLVASLVAILTTFGIFASLVFETIRFFGMISPIDFLFGSFWGPDPMGNPNNLIPLGMELFHYSGGRFISVQSSP